MSEKTYSLKVEKIIKADVEMIFNAWLDQENIAKWLMPGEGVTVPSPKIDPVEGGKFDLTMKVGENLLPHTGVYQKIERFKELKFTWNSPHGTNGRETVVQILFEELEDRVTKVILVHDFLPTVEQRDNHDSGWNRILDCLFGALNK